MKRVQEIGYDNDEIVLKARTNLTFPQSSFDYMFTCNIPQFYSLSNRIVGYYK